MGDYVLHTLIASLDGGGADLEIEHGVVCCVAAQTRHHPVLISGGRGMGGGAGGRGWPSPRAPGSHGSWGRTLGEEWLHECSELRDQLQCGLLTIASLWEVFLQFFLEFLLHHCNFLFRKGILGRLLDGIRWALVVIIIIVVVIIIVSIVVPVICKDKDYI